MCVETGDRIVVAVILYPGFLSLAFILIQSTPLIQRNPSPTHARCALAQVGMKRRQLTEGLQLWVHSVIATVVVEQAG